jgi:hypothetical protein
MSASRFLLPAGAAVLMGLISKGVASDAKRDRFGIEPSMEPSASAAPAVVTPEVELVSSSDESTTDDDLDDDSTVP